VPIDPIAAEQFVLANARLLDRHRLAVLLHGAAAAPVLAALYAYRNTDGGFGHALEPDVRGPESEPTAAHDALTVLASVGALDDPVVPALGRWLAGVADDRGGIPFVVPTTAASPHAPWMVPSDGPSHLTFGVAGLLARAGWEDPWLTRATAWCWERLERPDQLDAYTLKFALEFLDETPEDDRARAVLETLRPRIPADGLLPVAGGTNDERLTPLTLSPLPSSRSRTLFTAAQIDEDLDRLERAQQDDGGWDFDWLAWSPGQTVEWRGKLTLLALATLRAHGRVA
jgi:hypothetical protein